MKTLHKTMGAFLLLGATLLSACSGAKTGKLTITDGDAHADAVLPVSTIDSAYAWAMMQMTSVVHEATLQNNEFTYVVTDDGVTDTTSDMYFHRVWTFKGTYEEVDNGFKLAVPTAGTKLVDYGTRFADYESVWGQEGTFDLTANELAKFKSSVISIADGVLTIVSVA